MAQQNAAELAFESLSARIVALREEVGRLSGEIEGLKTSTGRMAVAMKPKDYTATFDGFLASLDALRTKVERELSGTRHELQRVRDTFAQDTSVASLHRRMDGSIRSSVAPLLDTVREQVKEMLEVANFRIQRLTFWRDAFTGFAAATLIVLPVHDWVMKEDYSQMSQAMRVAHAQEALGGTEAIETVIRVLSEAKNIPEMHVFSAYAALLNENEKLTECQARATAADKIVDCTINLQIYPPGYSLDSAFQ